MKVKLVPFFSIGDDLPPRQEKGGIVDTMGPGPAPLACWPSLRALKRLSPKSSQPRKARVPHILDIFLPGKSSTRVPQRNKVQKPVGLGTPGQSSARMPEYLISRMPFYLGVSSPDQRLHQTKLPTSSS